MSERAETESARLFRGDKEKGRRHYNLTKLTISVTARECLSLTRMFLMNSQKTVA